jgi:DNA/RNA-binding domain of Phe-tRNA-synthetase-like protein
MALVITLSTHPLLELAAFRTRFPRPLGELPVPEAVQAALRPSPPGPLPFAPPDDALRAGVRDLLRHGGYKPTGRGKPASEYLARAVGEGQLGSINLAVDACNAVSLHSGLPVSVVDLDRATAPFRVAIAAPGERYPFNASGQELDLEGLLCLYDAQGPCANPVKDSQRTKTHAGTLQTLAVVWGTMKAPGRAAAAALWYRSMLEGAGATCEDVLPAG